MFSTKSNKSFLSFQYWSCFDSIAIVLGILGGPVGWAVA